MCFKIATIVKVMITGNDHELHFPRGTTAQAPTWFGYRHTPQNVLMFCASQMKNPMSTNDGSSGLLRSRSSGRKITVARAYSPSVHAAIYQR